MINADKEFEIDYIDSSGMCEFRRCPTKYLFSRLMGLRLPDADTIAIDYGTDMHAAVPHCYDNDANCINIAMTEFSRGWEKRGYGDKDKKRNATRARCSLAEFNRVHRPSVCPYAFVEDLLDISAKTADIISRNELPFLVDIGGPLPLAGRIDAVVKMHATGDVWALDYKTASEISARYFACFDNAPATVGYSMVVSMLTGKDCQGLIIEAIRSSASNTESQMYHAFVNKLQVDMFLEFARATAADMLEANSSKLWPQIPAACSPYSMFGQPGRVCEYKDLCTIMDWREMVKFYEKTKPFHPFEVRR